MKIYIYSLEFQLIAIRNQHRNQRFLSGIFQEYLTGISVSNLAGIPAPGNLNQNALTGTMGKHNRIPDTMPGYLLYSSTPGLGVREPESWNCDNGIFFLDIYIEFHSNSIFFLYSHYWIRCPGIGILESWNCDNGKCLQNI